MRRDDDRGQTLPLVLVIMAAAMGTALVLGELGSRALAAARAQTAADAGALAAAAEGPGAGAAGTVGFRGLMNLYAMLRELGGDDITSEGLLDLARNSVDDLGPPR